MFHILFPVVLWSVNKTGSQLKETGEISSYFADSVIAAHVVSPF